MSALFENLEFDIVLSKIAELAASSVVADEILKLAPAKEVEAADKLLDQTGEALRILASHRPVLAFDDISTLVDKAEVGATLRPNELLKIKNSIFALRSLKSCVEASNADSLKDITAWVRTCDELESDIDRAVENDSDLKDNASDKLYSLRRAIVRANSKLKERLDGYTRQSEVSKFLQDNIVTVRGDRYVIPVRAEYRSSVKGLVHDVSSTGATVFIEPFAIVEANNELKTLKTEEFNETERILAELTREVALVAYELTECQRVLTECGVIFAKAEYAKRIDAYRPALNADGKISLKGARHPLISRDTVVPVDITLGEKRILLISGPNTGGKTVALKTVGLFALMAASGIFIPTTDGSKICVFEDIYCDIGDSQSIAQSLSTFSAHITNLSAITNAMNARSLVLLDEVGDGTDPDEGAALAVAIIKKIMRTKATAIVTTHFNAVKEFALGCSAISNACMQFDNVNFKPTYVLLQGVSGSSYALEIAEKLGLDPEIITDAKSALSNEKVAFDLIMRGAEKLRNDALREKRECEAFKVEAEKNAETAQKNKLEYEKKLSEINASARAMIRKSADEYAEHAQSIIDEIKEKLKNADSAALFDARKAAKKIYDGVPSESTKPTVAAEQSAPAELTDGARVYVSGLNKEGTISGSIRGKKALVVIGSVKTELPISSLTVIKDKTTEKPNRIVKSDAEPVNREIIMLGLTVAEATQQLDGIISDIPPHSVLRIVHGKGTGLLGKGIQNYLKRQPKVKSYRYGRYGEGDTGVTIVEIK